MHNPFPQRRARFTDFCGGIRRVSNFGYTAALVMRDYSKSFKNVESGTPEYDVVFHECNERNAKRVFKMVTKLGGYYVKFAQMASTMKDSGIPKEWTNELVKCQVSIC